MSSTNEATRLGRNLAKAGLSGMLTVVAVSALVVGLCTLSAAAEPRSGGQQASGAGRAAAAVEEEPGARQPGFLGVEASSLTPSLRQHFGAAEDQGVLISRVEAGSPAEAADLRVGDVLVAIDGVVLDTVASLRRQVRHARSGDTVELAVVRDGEETRLFATLGASRTARFSVDEDRWQELAQKFEEHDWEQLGRRFEALGERWAEVGERLAESFAETDWQDRDWEEWGRQWERRGKEWERNAEHWEKLGEEWGRMGEQWGEQWAEFGARFGSEFGAELGASLGDLGERLGESLADADWDALGDWVESLTEGLSEAFEDFEPPVRSSDI